MEMQNFIIYIGDFDLRNENVQAHLVKNNTKIFNRLGYSVSLIGVNRKSTFEEIATLQKLDIGEGNQYLELENTLTVSGLFKYKRTESKIMAFMDGVARQGNVKFVISYQAPTFAPILKRVAEWCGRHGAKYIVNCADITVFDSQPLLRRMVMTRNWNYLHKVNIRILQCDEKVLSDEKITSQKDLKTYMEHFELKGQGGTDFRPAFDYVADLIRKNEFRNLRGLLYFTDGKGIFPKKKPPYETAFIFCEESADDRQVPPWAMKLILPREDIEQEKNDVLDSAFVWPENQL